MAERAKLKVGFIPIIDCAPVVLAEELGAFERQGLDVEIRREVSWANVRDKLALGLPRRLAHPGGRYRWPSPSASTASAFRW